MAQTFFDPVTLLTLFVRLRCYDGDREKKMDCKERAEESRVEESKIASQYERNDSEGLGVGSKCVTTR